MTPLRAEVDLDFDGSKDATSGSKGASSFRPCDAVRSTMLIASLQSLRRRGCIDSYVRMVDPSARDPLLALVSPEWVPIALAEAHYAACDALALPMSEVLSIGNDVSRVDAAGAHLLLGLARAGGVTLWSVLERVPSNWHRMYRGSVIRTAKLGPKEASIVVAGNRLARFSYWRVGLRGIGEGLFRQFCARVFVKEVVERRAPDSASYVVSWV